jgi:hypothetical protein
LIQKGEKGMIGKVLGRRLQLLMCCSFAFVALGFFTTQINAQTAGSRPATASQDQIYKKITRAQMKAIMDSEGFSVTPDEDGDLVWKIEGFRSFMFVSKDEESLQFHASFRDEDATLAKVNEWNRAKRYSRTYLDAEGDPHLELDLDLAGGVTRARIVDFLKTCRVSFEAWRKEVVQ